MRNTAKRYPEDTKKEVVRLLSTGAITKSEAMQRYGISGGATIDGWIRRFGNGTLPKSKRGRPRKIDNRAATPKGKRGRPRKNKGLDRFPYENQLTLFPELKQRKKSDSSFKAALDQLNERRTTLVDEMKRIEEVIKILQEGK